MSKPEDDFYEGLLGGQQTTATDPSEPAAGPLDLEAPTQPKAVTSKNLFSHPDAHPVVLDMALLRFFNLDWFSWLPETLFSEIERVFKTSIAEVNRMKILAAQNLHVIDAFWDHWEVFEKGLIALNGGVPQLKVIQPPDLSSLFAGVDIANSIRKEDFSEDVSRYVAAAALYEHVTYAPPPIEFAQPYITQPFYHCKDCGKTGSALPPFDGYCDSCTNRFDQQHSLSLRPDQERVDLGYGKNIVLGKTYDFEPVKKRFEELDSLPPESLVSHIKEVPNDIEAAKLIVATDFMKLRTKQLQEQISSLGSWLGASA